MLFTEGSHNTQIFLFTAEAHSTFIKSKRHQNAVPILFNSHTLVGKLIVRYVDWLTATRCRVFFVLWCLYLLDISLKALWDTMVIIRLSWKHRYGKHGWLCLTCFTCLFWFTPGRDVIQHSKPWWKKKKKEMNECFGLDDLQCCTNMNVLLNFKNNSMCNKRQIHVTQKHTNIVGWL